MQTFNRRWMGMGLLSWIGCALLAFASSSCFGNIVVAGYPAFLGNNADPNVVIWPLNASGTQFGSMATPATEMLREDDRTVTFDWPGDLAHSLPAKIGSVSILLDPAPSAELRARVNELVRTIEQSNPNVNTSITVCAVPIGDVRDGEAFGATLGRLYAAASQQRSDLSFDGLIQFDLPREQPVKVWQTRLIVLPNAAHPEEYFVVISPLWLPFGPLDPNFYAIFSVPSERVVERLSDDGEVYFLEPWDMPPNARDSMDRLKSQVPPQPAPGVHVRTRWVKWPISYSELTSLKAVQLTLEGRTSDCTCQYCKAGAEL